MLNVLTMRAGLNVLHLNIKESLQNGELLSSIRLGSLILPARFQLTVKYFSMTGAVNVNKDGELQE